MKNKKIVTLGGVEVCSLMHCAGSDYAHPDLNAFSEACESTASKLR